MLRVALLGEQAITRDGAGVQVRSSRGVALVAFLVVHAGVPQARERIAGLFWPESADGQALTNLRHELHHLRQVLAEEPSLVVTSRDLCWRDTGTCRVDVRVFDVERKAALDAASADDGEGVLVHAAKAIEEYRGDLLPGGYEDWLLEARSELERWYVELCDLLCQARAERGDMAGAADATRRRIRLRRLGWSAGPGNLACSRTFGRLPWPADPVLRWSVVVPGWGRPAWSPSSPGWRGGEAPWWPAASVSGHRPGWRLRR